MALLLTIAFFAVVLTFYAWRGHHGTSDRLCVVCGTVGRPTTVTRGSIGVEIIMWLMFIVPGVIYSIWRLTTRREACRACGSDQLIPVQSPRAQEILRSRNT